MTIEAPVPDLDAEFNGPGAAALPWTDAEEQLRRADVPQDAGIGDWNQR
jgi:hypothetical protein